MIRSALFLLFLFAVPTAFAADVKIAQSGPGVTGSFAPISSDNAVVLASETVTIDLLETEARVEGAFILANPTDAPVTVRAGVPSLTVSAGDMALSSVTAAVDGTPVTLTPIDEPLEPDFDYTPYLPLIQTFDLIRRWLVVDVTVPARGRRTVAIGYDVPYLFKHEELEGRNQMSPYLFRYERAPAARWAGTPGRSEINVNFRMATPTETVVNPKPQRTASGRMLFAYGDREPTRFDTITAVYDPITFGITPYGVDGAVPPVPLEEDGAALDYGFLFDADPETAWCEGERGDAVGRGFEVEWGKLRRLRAVRLFPGRSTNPDVFHRFNRLQTVNLYLTKPGWRSGPIRVDVPDRPESIDVPITGDDEATMLVIEILAVHRGPTRATCIGELQPHFVDGR